MQFGWQFREFLKAGLLAATTTFSGTPPKRAWLEYGPMRVYLRIGYRTIEGRATLCVQIANIETPEAYERRGLFTRMLAVIREATALPVLLEGCRADFADHLLTTNKGWKLASPPPVPAIAKDIVLY